MILNPDDHDLLIELRTEMRGIRNDLKELKDNMANRILTLENSIIEKTEVYRLKSDADKIHESFVLRFDKLETKQQGDHDSITKHGVYAAIGLLVVQLLIKFIL